MKGHRYKGGWFGDSYGHSLAAQGYTMKYNADKSRMMMRMRQRDDMVRPSEMQMMDSEQVCPKMRSNTGDVMEDVTDIPQEVKMDLNLDSDSKFKLTDAAIGPGSVVKNAGSAIGDMVRFSKDVVRQ